MSDLPDKLRTLADEIEEREGRSEWKAVQQLIGNLLATAELKEKRCVGKRRPELRAYFARKGWKASAMRPT